jgi:hypothetical protein
MDIVQKIIEYESEGMNLKDTVDFFSELFKQGKISHLQGSYQRTAQNLIDIGILDNQGKILKYPDDL